ncbi:leucine-rich repeat-containing protein 49 [Halyomorpha halys]|uniref:leucine-rich repeat-containing protein 49 n=1 Tax=Halyomorpha halys TaxID=286706 RepID=UPI0034D20F0F
MEHTYENHDEKKTEEKCDTDDQILQSDPGLINTRKTGQKQKYKIRDKGGDYLIEINGNVLNVYGQGALRFIDRPWNTSKAKEVTTVKFSYLDFNYVSLILGRVKYRFPKAENYCFVETNIYCLGQINALADIQGLTSLTIEKKGNPIAEKEWRSYAIYRLSHWGLKTINESQV